MGINNLAVRGLGCLGLAGNRRLGVVYTAIERAAGGGVRPEQSHQVALQQSSLQMMLSMTDLEEVL